MAKLGTTKSKKKTGIPAPTATQTATAKRGNVNQFPQGATQAPNKQAWEGEVARRQSYEDQMKPQVSALNNQPINNQQFAQVMEAKKTGGKVMPQDPNAAMIFQKNQESLADKKLREEVTKKDIEDKKKLAIKAELNPVTPTPGVQASIPQNVESNIPLEPGMEFNAQNVGTFVKEVYGQGLNRAIRKLTSGNLGGALSAFIGSGLSPKGNYISMKTEDAEVYYNSAEEQLNNAVTMAEQGLDRNSVEQLWEKAVNEFGLVDSNLQRLTKLDENYYQGKGRELKNKMEMTRKSIAIKRRMIDEAFAASQAVQQYANTGLVQ